MTDEIRITSETGGSKGKKPVQAHHIDPLALSSLYEVAAYGAEKYEDDYNYIKGFDWSLSYDALQRHLMAFWSGENIDSESKLLHLAHAMWHCACLITFSQREIGKDDRPKFKGK